MRGEEPSQWQQPRQQPRRPQSLVVLQGVSGDGLVNTMDVCPQSRHLGSWNARIIEKARLARQEWLDENPHFGSRATLRQDWWMHRSNHQLAILDTLPRPNSPPPQVQSTIWPGTTVQALEFYTLDSETFEVKPHSDQMHRMGTLRIIKIQYNKNGNNNINLTSYHNNDAIASNTSGTTATTTTTTTTPASILEEGYVVWSIDGYTFLAEGTALETSRVNYWRVTYPHGAWMRSGPSLQSPCRLVIPYGALVAVRKKVIHHDLGVSRLFVQYENQWGWCSEFINPLSGQRGPILQPLPLLIPLSIQVCLPAGALVRESVELSSPARPETTLRYKSYVTITQRLFSEHPEENCIQRLRLANGRGWISQCLNTREREEVVDEATYRAVSSFDPTNPGQFHLDQQPDLPETVPIDDLPVVSHSPRSTGLILSTHSTDQLIVPSIVPSITATSSSSSSNSPQNNSNNNYDESMNCVVCLTNLRNATIVHGETGHVACCLVCARILRAREKPCPVCRLSIDLVIQHFYA